MTGCLRLAFVGFLFWTLAACAGGRGPENDRSCSRAICGCWEDHTLQAIVSVVGSDGRPASGVTLSCEANRQAFGTTDAEGTLRLVATGRTSPGCGFLADCEMASLVDRDGNTLATFALTPLFRRQKAVADTYTLSTAPVNSHLE